MPPIKAPLIEVPPLEVERLDQDIEIACFVKSHRPLSDQEYQQKYKMQFLSELLKVDPTEKKPLNLADLAAKVQRPTPENLRGEGGGLRLSFDARWCPFFSNSKGNSSLKERWYIPKGELLDRVHRELSSAGDRAGAVVSLFSDGFLRLRDGKFFAWQLLKESFYISHRRL